MDIASGSLYIIFLVLGAVLMDHGMRGRKLDDHPLCRRCRFDLVGNPQTSSCPECGEDLQHPNAVCIGNRKRRPWFMVMGVACFILAMGGLFSETIFQH